MKHGTIIYDPSTKMRIEFAPVDDPYDIVKTLNLRLRPIARELGVEIHTTEEV